MVFKVAMTRDLKSITELSLIAEKINFLNFSNSVLTKTVHLVKLDLSYNQIDRIQHLDYLKMLQELNLSGNPIQLIEDLNLPQLKVLQLDGCRIKVIENLKSCKKLEQLSLNGNLITDLSIQGGAQQLIELKMLSATNNKIQQLK